MNTHTTLLGIDPDTGKWRTAPKKRYPQALCAAMGRAVPEFVAEAYRLCDREALDPTDLPDGLSRFFQALDSYAAAAPNEDLALDFAGFSNRGPRDHRFDRPAVPLAPQGRGDEP
eukprot:1731487-Pyramimonas_sp.AAC.1